MASKPSPSQAGGLDRTSSRLVPSARRPATVGVAAGTAKTSLKTSLKTRSSLSSITNRKQESATEAENKPKVPTNGLGKRTSVAGSTRSTSPTKASLGRRSGLASATNADEKSTQGRSSPASLLKTATKTIHPNARPSNASGTPRSTRPIRYTPQRTTKVGQFNPTEQRGSAVSTWPSLSSASDDTPSPAATELRGSAVSTSSSPPSASDATPCPAAVYKSTPSATQPERPKLPARKSTTSVTMGQRLHEFALVGQMLRGAVADDGDEHDEVKEEYGRQVDKLLAELRSKLEEARLNEGKLPLDADYDDSESKAKLALSCGKIAGLQHELFILRQKQARLNEGKPPLNADYDESTRVLDVSAGPNDGDSESKAELALSWGKIAGLQHELFILRQKHVDLKNESDDKIARQEREHSQQMNEMHSLQVRKDQQAATNAQRRANEFDAVLRSHLEKIQALEAAAWEQSSRILAQINSYVDKIQELQAMATKQATDHKSEALIRDKEIEQMRSLIEILQDEVRDIHESKDREIERQLVQLTQEHDKAMSDLRFKHEEALLKERDTGAKDVSELVEKHAQELDDLRAQSALYVERLKAKLEFARYSRDNTEDAQKKAGQDTEHHIRDLEQRLQASNRLVENVKSALGEAKNLLNSLEDELRKTRLERDWLKNYEATSVQLLHESQREIGDLRQYIDTREQTWNGGCDHLVNADDIQAELDATATRLSEQETELAIANDRHAALVRELRSEHGKKVEELHQVIGDLQSVQNETIRRANREEESYGLEIQRLQSQHDQALDASRDEVTGLKQQMEQALQDDKLMHVIFRDQVATLQESLQQAEKVAEQRAVRLQETEAALEVTKAELLEMQTNRPNSSPYTSSPPTQAGYHRTSLWTASDNASSATENSGASIIGNMAGMREQVRQLANTNEEILSNEERICRNMSSLYSPEPLRWLDSTIAEEDEES